MAPCGRRYAPQCVLDLSNTLFLFCYFSVLALLLRCSSVLVLFFLFSCCVLTHFLLVSLFCSCSVHDLFMLCFTLFYTGTDTGTGTGGTGLCTDGIVTDTESTGNSIDGTDTDTYVTGICTDCTDTGTDSTSISNWQ